MITEDLQQLVTSKLHGVIDMGISASAVTAIVYQVGTGKYLPFQPTVFQFSDDDPTKNVSVLTHGTSVRSRSAGDDSRLTNAIDTDPYLLYCYTNTNGIWIMPDNDLVTSCKHSGGSGWYANIYTGYYRDPNTDIIYLFFQPWYEGIQEFGGIKVVKYASGGKYHAYLLKIFEAENFGDNIAITRTQPEFTTFAVGQEAVLGYAVSANGSTVDAACNVSVTASEGWTYEEDSKTLKYTSGYQKSFATASVVLGGRTIEITETFYPEYPSDSEITISPKSEELTVGQAKDLQFTLTDVDDNPFTGVASWSYVITDKNGTVDIDSAPWVSWVSAEGEKALLRITADAPGGHEITVIAAWGTEDDPQSVWAKVTIPVARWAGLKSFQTGLALGLAGKPLPIKKEPAEYLYNNIRLPKLPEYDKETYPYAVIGSYYDGWITYYRLYLASRTVSMDSDSIDIKGPAKYMSCNYYTGEANWRNFSGQNEVQSGYVVSPYMTPIWANHDIRWWTYPYDLRLPASEPVPVQE
jgi:hypothetical protein